MVSMTELHDERIRDMKAKEQPLPTAFFLQGAAQTKRNRARLAAYRRKSMERQDTAQRIFWGPW